MRCTQCSLCILFSYESCYGIEISLIWWFFANLDQCFFFMLLHLMWCGCLLLLETISGTICSFTLSSILSYNLIPVKAVFCLSIGTFQVIILISLRPVTMWSQGTHLFPLAIPEPVVFSWCNVISAFCLLGHLEVADSKALIKLWNCLMTNWS